MGLREVAKELTYKYFGNSLEVGKYFIYKGRPIKIVSGQFLGEFGGLSNHWSWKEVLPSGHLSRNRNSGYGGNDSVFRPISKENAIKLATKLSKKKEKKYGGIKK